MSVLFFGFLAQSVGRGERRKGESGNLGKEKGDTRRLHILEEKGVFKRPLPHFLFPVRETGNEGPLFAPFLRADNRKQANYPDDWGRKGEKGGSQKSRQEHGSQSQEH